MISSASSSGAASSQASKSAHPGIREHTLFFGQLDSRATEYTLYKLVKPFGKIVRIDFQWHKTGPKRGLPRGYAFVEFEDRATAVKAKQSLHGHRVGSRNIVVRFVEDRIVYEPGKNEDVREYKTSTDIEAERRKGQIIQQKKKEQKRVAEAETCESQIEAIKMKLARMQQRAAPIPTIPSAISSTARDERGDSDSRPSAGEPQTKSSETTTHRRDRSRSRERKGPGDQRKSSSRSRSRRRSRSRTPPPRQKRWDR